MVKVWLVAPVIVEFLNVQVYADLEMPVLTRTPVEPLITVMYRDVWLLTIALRLVEALKMDVRVELTKVVVFL